MATVVEKTQNAKSPVAVTAVEMGARQREISVSEFFTKNRHLLGFDNPRKALLTCVKEAVDNALDASEEAGILPEVVVKVECASEEQPPPPASQATRFRVTVIDYGPGIVRQQIPPIFAKLLYGSKFHRLRMSRGQQGIGISAAGMYAQLTTGKPVQITSRTSARAPAHYFEVQIDTKKNEPRIFENKKIDWESHRGTQVTLEIEGRYQKGPRVGGRVSRADGHRQSARAARLPHAGRGDPRVSADHPRAAASAARDQAASLRDRVRHALEDAARHQEPLARRVSRGRFQPRVRRGRRGDLRDGQALAERAAAERPRRRRRSALQGDPVDQDHGAAVELHLADRREGDPPRALQADQGRVLHGGHAAARRYTAAIPFIIEAGLAYGKGPDQAADARKRRRRRSPRASSRPRTASWRGSSATPTASRCCISSRPARPSRPCSRPPGGTTASPSPGARSRPDRW